MNAIQPTEIVAYNVAVAESTEYRKRQKQNRTNRAKRFVENNERK